MATKRRKKRKKTKLKTLLNRLLYAAIICGGVYFGYTLSVHYGQGDGQVFIHFIDVGQGKATLIQSPYGNMLIDAGAGGLGPFVLQYLQNQGVNHLSYLVATHPHADHIGGIAYIKETMPVERLLKPDRTHDTQTFERFIYAIESNNTYVRFSQLNSRVYLGDISFTILAPSRAGYIGLNDYSIVLLMEYGGIRFLFASDAEHVSEREMLALGQDISAHVLQVGHHGSHTSTTQEFLQAVNPVIAVISAGQGNQFGHPHGVVLERLNNHGVYIYRTDYHGTIVMSTDGEQLWIH